MGQMNPKRLIGLILSLITIAVVVVDDLSLFETLAMSTAIGAGCYVAFSDDDWLD